MDPMILTGIVLILIILVGMGMALVIGNSSARKQRTMAVIKSQTLGSGEGGSDAPRNEQDKRRAEIAKKLKEQDNAGHEKKKKKATLSAMIEQAGLKIKPMHYWLFSALSAVLLTLLAKLMGMSIFVTILFFIIGLLGVPRFVLRWRIKRRQKKFLTEFADALEAMARLLKAGMPVSEAIAMAGREFAGPVGEEMSLMYESQKIGIPLPEAALQAARRMPLTEMQMLATGLSIQAQTGASLSEVLINLAKVIRARYRLRRKVQALSSEAKASAMIIGSLPFLVGGGLFLINPDYMDPLFATGTGKTLLAGAACWMGLGILVMKIMINFRI
jgi:tight adherence protein B